MRSFILGLRLTFAVALATFLLSASAFAAGPITAPQWASFRAHVKAQPQGSAIYTAYHKDNGPGNAQGDPDALVALYNANSGTSIWRTDVRPSELITAIVMSEFVALPAQTQNGMLLLLQLGSGGLDASNATVRASFATLWTNKTTLTNLVALGQRTATVFEAITAYLTAAAPANVCAPEIYGHVLDRFEVSAALWDNAGNPL